MSPDLESLESRAGHRFADRALLVRALTHRSFPNEARADDARSDNEQLEFLGDAVLDLVVADLLVRRLPVAPEGDLSRLRASLVSERGLASVARALDLGAYLRLGKGEDRTGGRDKPRVLAGALEALVGAVYVDGGFGASRGFVSALVAGPLERVVAGRAEPDHKTRLQEVAQRRFGAPPLYRLAAAEGPAHERTFDVEVTLDGGVLGRGRGPSKKEAEQRAAAAALAALAERPAPPPGEREA